VEMSGEKRKDTNPNTKSNGVDECCEFTDVKRKIK
jgi:hypothetical protein